MAAFTWGAGGAQLTPEQIAERQKVAQALIEKAGDTSPIQHWSQGANRVIQGLMGGYDSYKNDEATKANTDANKEMIAALLTGMSGGTAPVATTTAPAPLASNPPAMTGGMPSPVAMAPSVNNKIYRNDEPSPLDPPQGKDRDLAIRTVYGEDPGSSALGVANVIRNRAVAGKFGGDTIPGVVLAKNQFEPWNNDAARARMQSLDPNSAEYKRLGAIVDQAYTDVNDPTNGATHFFAPKAQAALGRPVPTWGQGAGQDIGVHRFFGGAQNPTMVATNAVPPELGARPGAPVQPSQTTWGDREAEAAGLYDKPATVAQRSVGVPGAPADPAALPANAAPAQYVAPGTGEVIAPAAAPAARPSINPAAAYAIIADPRANEGTKKIAALMLQNQIAQEGVTHVDAGNSIVVMDKRGNEVRRIAKGEPNKGPEFGVIGKDDFGNEKYGWRDPRTQSVTPVAAGTAAGGQMPVTIPGPDGKPVEVPAGQDPKVYREILSKAGVAATQPAAFKDVSDLRDRLTQLPSYKNISQAAPIYKAMFDTAGTNSKASDLNLVYGLGKIMDPTSVVREGEMIMVKNTASLPDWLVGAANGLNGGQALTPETREAILREAHNRVTSYKTMFDQDASMYRGIAKRNRMDEADVIPEFGEFKPWTRPPAAPAVTTKPGTQAPAIAKGQTKTGVQWSVQ